MIEVIARGIIRHNGNILLCRNVGWNDEYFYFPGGHVEFGETSSEALVREIQEEIGIHVNPPTYIGGVEEMFEQSGTARHEISLVYAVDIDDPNIESHEPDKVSFQWIREDQIKIETILPDSMKQAIIVWLEDQKSFWIIPRARS